MVGKNPKLHPKSQFEAELKTNQAEAPKHHPTPVQKPQDQSIRWKEMMKMNGQHW